MRKPHLRCPAAAALILVLGAAAAGAQPPANPDYARALEITRGVADGLRSYEVTGTLRLSGKVRGQTGERQMEASMRGAARWPDRLLSSQEGDSFQLHFGTGAAGSWFFLGQLGNAFVGAPMTLSRRLGDAGAQELSTESIFNFYAGISQFLLDGEAAVAPGTGQETLTVGGREVACQVFHVPAAPETDDRDVPREGERRFWFDPASGLLLKVSQTVTMWQNGVEVQQSMDYALDAFTLNQGVDDAVFAYTPPAGARIVDTLEKLTNPDSMVGQIAPDITFTGFDGVRSDLAGYRGKVVFLDFWATWCGPCRLEMPHLQKLYEELGPGGEVAFIGASSEDPATVRKFLAGNPYTFPIVLVGPEDAVKRFGVTSIPAGFVIDREGVIRAHLIGAQSEAQLRAALAKAGVGGK